MKTEELDQQLRQLQEQSAISWGKLLAQLKRQFDTWAVAELASHGYADFKMAYMPLLMNIQPEGITNNELAKKARVTKQAMSKVVKELLEFGYIKTSEHDTDKRSAVIYLTSKGKKMVITARMRMLEVEKEYEALIGKKKFEELKESLRTIIQHRDQKTGLECF